MEFLMKNKQRPLSPHLQIYKPQLTSSLSIFHRFSALIMLGGVLALIGFFYSIAMKSELYACFSSAVAMLWGKALLSIFILFFWFFVGTSLRYLVWDTGRGFELKNVYASGFFVLIMSVVLTAFSVLALWGKLE
jgi:succinate dehydrogenase / fumarate reductase cytochrome b subunit